MPSFSSENLAIAVVTSSAHRKIFQIAFQRRNGTLFVAFPYFRDAPGILSMATLKANQSFPANVDLKDGGKFTSHRVKYSHHPDGNAHFSQDGKIYTQIRRKSVPLGEAVGHLFTVQAQGIDDFEAVQASARQPAANAKRTRINFKFDGPDPAAIKFVGYWYSEPQLLRRFKRIGNRPWCAMERPDGTVVHGAIIRNPFLGFSENCYLLLSCEAIPILDKDRYSALTFIGGFDPPHIAFDSNVDLQFLALSYPTESFDSFASAIGTVDLRESG